MVTGTFDVIKGDLGDRDLSLARGNIVATSLEDAPSLAKKKDGKRNTRMRQIQI
ncbi:hypothetical protein LCH33_000700 [Pseudomonas amygdali]|uniref:hypothetical protein n=1 Tax=Pseudomonas amygdali TaxID=47877 RepID=UPI0013520A2F|nr:hypothetical protein LCH33_000700 [Pseudomonas amygdali]